MDSQLQSSGKEPPADKPVEALQPPAEPTHAEVSCSGCSNVSFLDCFSSLSESSMCFSLSESLTISGCKLYQILPWFWFFFGEGGGLNNNEWNHIINPTDTFINLMNWRREINLIPILWLQCYFRCRHKCDLFGLWNCWHLGLYDSIFHRYRDEHFLQDYHLNPGEWCTLLSP